MSGQRVANMTLEELNQLIERAVERRFQMEGISNSKDARSVAEILDSIDKHRWTPPSGVKSPLELLREDRDA